MICICLLTSETSDAIALKLKGERGREKEDSPFLLNNYQPRKVRSSPTLHQAALQRFVFQLEVLTENTVAHQHYLEAVCSRIIKQSLSQLASSLILIKREGLKILELVFPALY